MNFFVKVTLFTLLSTFSFFSQEKFEREYRVTEFQVPIPSSTFIKSLQFHKKVKWYAEESQDSKTFEAKVRHNNYKYSIEFTEKGNIIDIEKTIKFNELSKKIKENITRSLSIRFQKFKIKKTQVQFLCSNTKEYKTLFIDSLSKDFYINYELVIKAKLEGNSNLFEILINENGQVLKELKFTPSTSLNLEF
ncbi:hypothetical protein [uncultured Polaribacter sp.]|uniref:hypothetical protein n=1 Tax=uncultured Polaribacter sp. TaxID=174711 RepID=UPI00262E9859|nr:hypothetical protein [uncultured Polaribacter sp.]